MKVTIQNLYVLTDKDITVELKYYGENTFHAYTIIGLVDCNLTIHVSENNNRILLLENNVDVASIMLDGKLCYTQDKYDISFDGDIVIFYMKDYIYKYFFETGNHYLLELVTEDSNDKESFL